MNYDPREILQFRRQKALFFARSEASPFFGESSNPSENLSYFEPTPEFVFEASVRILDDKQRTWLATSTGDSEPYFRYAVAMFAFEHKGYSLALFLPEGSSDASRLFVPFNDASNAQETYKAGRYLEVNLELSLEAGSLDISPEIDPELKTVRLDFNYAYNPYCAYSERYRCPIPPVENSLQLAICAGEKIPKNQWEI